MASILEQRGQDDFTLAEVREGRRAACEPLPTLPTRPRSDRAIRRPVNRREAGGAPAIGIEARKGRDPASPGLGAKHESPGPQGHRPPEKEPEKPASGRE